MNYKASALYENGVYYPDTDGEPMAEGDTQRKYMIYVAQSLSDYYYTEPDVYVSGNILLYYEEGNPRKVISPDVLVVHDVPNHGRNIYKTWEEGEVPKFVMEITSKTTKHRDLNFKFNLYQSMGIIEYFLFDPTGDYLKPQIRGYRLVDGRYVKSNIDLLGGELRISSYVLDLDFILTKDKELAIYDSFENNIFSRPSELRADLRKKGEQLEKETLRADQNEERAEQERQRAEQQRQRAEAAEQEIARLKALLGNPFNL